MSLIHDALTQGGQVETLELNSILQSRSFSGLIAMLTGWLGGLLVGRWMPLQSLLFWHPRYRDLIESTVDRVKPDTVYFDGVRTGVYLPGLRKRNREVRLVCDFDDLMSRRMAHLHEERQPVSLGYLAKYVPFWISRYVIQPMASTIIPFYEARALASLETRIMASADAVVLVSSVEADYLRQSVRADLANKVEVIPPSMPQGRAFETTATIHRFVFIGSDSLLQNRRTIEALGDIWKRLHPTTPLHIFGRQKGKYSHIPGIIVHGFVEDIAEAYVSGSVMLAPSYVSGGVKTKVLEAFAYGIVVVGNKTSFEGIDAPTKPLIMESEELEEFVCSPAAYIQKLAQATQDAISSARDRHNPVRVSQLWRSVVWPDYRGT